MNKKIFLITLICLLAAGAVFLTLSYAASKSGMGTAVSSDESTAQKSGGTEENTVRMTCDEITQYVLESGLSFPAHMNVTDKNMLSDVMGYDMSIAEDHSTVTQLVSVDVFELTVILPAEGKSSSVKEMLDRRRDYLINSAAFYPSQIEAAEASVVGSCGEYYYLICDIDAEHTAEAEEMLIQCLTASS